MTDWWGYFQMEQSIYHTFLLSFEILCRIRLKVFQYLSVQLKSYVVLVVVYLIVLLYFCLSRNTLKQCAKLASAKFTSYQPWLLGALEPNSMNSRGHQHRTALAAQCQNKATQPILQGRIGNISCETVAWHASIAVQNACRIEEHCISTNNSHFVKRFCSS